MTQMEKSIVELAIDQTNATTTIIGAHAIVHLQNRIGIDEFLSEARCAWAAMSTRNRALILIEHMELYPSCKLSD